VAEEVMDSAAQDVDIPDDDESGEFGSWGG
jgi:hypothetical protein